jgi:RNA polymerase sigma-70 factor, ECF subfamily
VIAQLHAATIEEILGEEEHLRRIARRLTRCDADAEDLVQETLMRAWRARDRFEPGTSMRAWTTTILRRVFLTDAIRAKRRGLCNDTDAGGPLANTSGPSFGWRQESAPSVTGFLERLDDAVKRALDHVPEVYRTPFFLAVIEGLSCAEIAQRLRTPEGTVMSRIHRARQRLKTELLHGRYLADAMRRPRPTVAA